jgi:peptidoglycan/LPS O-acetylase OafA/YrhL
MRVAVYFLFPESRPYVWTMLHTKIDTLMFGCSAALWSNDPRFQLWLKRAFKAKLHIAAAAYIFILNPILGHYGQGKYLLTVGLSLESFSIALVMLWLIQNPKTVVGNWLNSKVMVYFGTISYSLYLWQQLLCTSENTTFTHYFPLSFLCTWAAAELSHRFVEKPFLQIKKRFEPAARIVDEQGKSAA